MEVTTEAVGGANPIDKLTFVYGSARSLLHNIPERAGVIFRPIYEDNANSPEIEPLNTEFEVLSEVDSLLESKNTPREITRSPYWDKSKRYSISEVFGGTIQSFDLHDEVLPATILPPEEDIRTFIETVKTIPHRVRVSEQLAVALDLSGNDIMGAVNICWIANRFMARGADTRAYPNIPIDGALIYDWNDQIAQFKTFNDSGKNDGPGDNYYFWTHAFGAIAFSERSLQAGLAQIAFSRGTQIMAFVRKNIATGNQPNITAHEPASTIGRDLGLMINKRSRQAQQSVYNEGSVIIPNMSFVGHQET